MPPFLLQYTIHMRGGGGGGSAHVPSMPPPPPLCCSTTDVDALSAVQGPPGLRELRYKYPKWTIPIRPYPHFVSQRGVAIRYPLQIRDASPTKQTRLITGRFVLFSGCIRALNNFSHTNIQDCRWKGLKWYSLTKLNSNNDLFTVIRVTFHWPKFIIIHSSVCINISKSILLCLHPSIHPSIRPSSRTVISPSIHPTIQSSFNKWWMNLFINPFIHPSIHQFIHSFIHSSN